MAKKKNRTPSLVRRNEQPEDALWRNVVTQAIQDATMTIPQTACDYSVFYMYQLRERKKIRDQARKWIAKQQEDFHTVCSLAGLEADRVHAFAMAKIREAMEREHQETVTRNFVRGSEPGVGANFSEGVGDRRPSTTQKSEKLEFFQNGGEPQ